MSDLTDHPDYFVHETACVDSPCTIGEGTQIWHFSHIMKNVHIGSRCSFGQNVFIAEGVRIGNCVKVQNNVSIYQGATIEDDVFLGPSCVLTNVVNPRSQISRKNEYRPTHFRRGATVGANATILCGIELGCYCFIAAGAVLTHHVPDYALVAGVPAKPIGWMSRHGYRLDGPDQSGILRCPHTGWRYQHQNGILRCLDHGEDRPLDNM